MPQHKSYTLDELQRIGAKPVQKIYSLEELQQMGARPVAASEPKPYQSPVYPGGPESRTPMNVMQDQAASVVKGVPAVVTGIPAVAKTLWDVGRDIVTGKGSARGQEVIKGVITGAVKPFVTAAQGLGEHMQAYGIGMGPESLTVGRKPIEVALPEDPRWTEAAEAGGAMLAGAALPNVASGVTQAARIGMDAIRRSPASARLVKNMEARAAANKARALKPATLEGQAAAQKIAPELSKRGMASGIRGGKIDRSVRFENTKAGMRVRGAENRLAQDVRPEYQMAKGPILDEIDDTIRSLDPDLFSGAIGNLKKLRRSVDRIPDYAPFERALKLRRDLDKVVEDMGGFKNASTAADRIKVTTTRGVSDIVRRSLNDLDPALKSANHDYWLTRKALDIVERRDLGEVGKVGLELPGRGSLLDDIIATGAGSAVGGTAGAVAAEVANLARQSRGYTNIKSGFQQKVADFMRQPRREPAGLLTEGAIPVGPVPDPSAVRGIPATLASREIRGLLPEARRIIITPESPDPSRLIVTDAAKGIARDPKTGRMFRYYSGDKVAVSSQQMPNPIQEIRAALEQNKTLYVRWSRGPEFDLKEGARSRDYVTGTPHEGLSAVEITSDMSDAAILRRINEYGFLRMKDPELRPVVYSGERVGTDSDGYSLIRPAKEAVRLQDTLMGELDSGIAEAATLKELIADAEGRLTRITDSSAREIVETRLNGYRQRLADIQKK